LRDPFSYAENSLLNGRTFQSLAHLNDVTRWWLENVSDVHVHRTTNQRPLDRHGEELPYLIPLPARAFDPSPVVYRVVDAEGFVAWRSNRYSVPWRRLPALLAVVVGDEGREIHLLGDLQQKVHQMILRQPLPRRRRKQVLLIRRPRPKLPSHPCLDLQGT